MEIGSGETTAAAAAAASAVDACWWWGGASAAQMTAAVTFVRRGYVGSGGSMPLRAFLVASLFVGTGATAGVGVLHASGLRDLEDWKKFGEGIRRSLGAPLPRRRVAAGEPAVASSPPTPSPSDELTDPPS